MWYVLQENDELKVKIEVCTNQKKRLSSEVVDTNTYLGTRVSRIFGYSNIFEYFPVRIFIRIIFVSFL